MFIKPFLLSLFFTAALFTNLLAQDIKDIAGKMSFPNNLPIPRFIISLPDSVNGISIVYEDMKSITTEKLEKLKKVELVELRFSNQFELDKEIELLTNFPSMKYLILGDWRYAAKITSKAIKLPEVLMSYKNIVAVKFNGEWPIDHHQSFTVLKELPKLRYLFFEDFRQAIPETMKNLEQLRGISFHSTRVVDFPEWITQLKQLESISLAMVSFNFKGSAYLNYFDALSKLQQLPLLKSLYLSYFSKNDFSTDRLKFNRLEKIELSDIDFNTNKGFLDFLTNQKNLQSITISGSTPKVLDQRFAQLKELRNLTINGRRDSLQINFSLKELHQLKSLKVSNVKLFLNNSDFPDNLAHLELSSMSLKYLPEPILKLKKLETLSLAYDSLLNLPYGISELKKLESLDVSGNLIRALPEDFVNLKSLKTLDLSVNPIDELGKSIGRLKNLRKLEIKHGNLRNLPMDMGQLQRLALLDVSDNFIESIPESIITVKNLKILKASSNQLIALPAKIGDMKALEELDLDFNNIKRLPVSIGALEAIKRIYLGFNDLDSLPVEIADLSSLEELRLNTGKVSDAKKYNYIREIYRKDDPKPEKKVTVNSIKNFPENLNKWSSLKKLNLNYNNEINGEQLMKGVFTISSRGYSLELEGCGISDLPNQGWPSFFVGNLNLRDNRISKVPAAILQAPYLSSVNMNNNRLAATSNNLNQYVGNRYEKALWFVDLGIISTKELPQTDSMVLALVNKSNNHYYRKEFKRSVELVNMAIGINESLTLEKIFLTNMGEANYQVGNYRTAIEYLTKAIERDTAGSIRVMNLVIPDFEFRAKSYLKLGDTAKAINDYKTLSENFSDSWGEVGVLYKAVGQLDESNIAFEKGFNRYQEQINYMSKGKESFAMQQLSQLELLILKEEFDRAIKFAANLEKEFKSIQHLTLLQFLKVCAEVGNGTFDITRKSALLNYITTNKKSISGWSYELFFRWLSITKIAKEKEMLIREITDNIKP